MMTSPNQAFAKAGFNTELFKQTIVPNGIPTDIQFMPPGQQTITPSIDGKPFPVKIQVNQELAGMLNVQLQKMRREALAGQGDMPFIDFNHDDAEASGEVLELYWGGSDMLKGGIRMKVNWTAAGTAALQGKMYRRFSPGWLLDKKTYEPVGITANMGGLVNRAAFTNIQPIVAKAADLQAAGDDFASLVVARQALKHISRAEAAAEIQTENPSAAFVYASRIHVGAGAITLALENHPFLAQAKAVAAQHGLGETEAQTHLARVNFPLYRQYCGSLQTAARAKATEAVSVNRPANLQKGFLQLVQAKQAAGMSLDNALRVAQVERPDLLETYNASFR